VVSKQTTYPLIIWLILLLLVLFIADLMVGSVYISPGEFLHVLTGSESTKTNEVILLTFRLPKALTAILVGAGLSVAGLLMQTMFRNPLAGPFVLGISSGASLGVAILIMATGLTGVAGLVVPIFQNLGLVMASIAGSMMVLLLVIFVSLRLTDSVSILIVGIMFGSITGAIVSVMQYFSDPDSVHSFLVWTFGSISGLSWGQLAILSPVILISLFVATILRKPLNAILLGENYARGLGINVSKARIWIIILTGILAGAITAFAGPIAFIGIAVPHLARYLFKTANHRFLIPAVIFIGGSLMLICDMISQLPGSSQVLPINSVTAVFGAPVVIWVIVRRRKGKVF